MNCIRDMLGSLYTAYSLHWAASKGLGQMVMERSFRESRIWGYRQGDYAATGMLFFTAERR